MPFEFSANLFVEEKKITQYLLNPEHTDGKSKCKFFVKHGFSQAMIDTFQTALLNHGRNQTVTDIRLDRFGAKRVTVDCNCNSPDGINPCIRTVWEIRPNSEAPRLITAHPN